MALDTPNLALPTDAVTTPDPDVDHDPLWYKDAVIYQAHVKSFFDSNNDGVGDFQGITQKLDYLQGIGITCLWLLPFFPSPLRDDGYDIADYPTSIRRTARSTISRSWSAPRTRGTSGSSSSWSSTTLRISTRGSSAPAMRRRDRPSARSTSGATRIAPSPKRGSSSPTRRNRTGRSIRSPGSTTGTGSSRTSPISTTTTPPSSMR